MEQKGNNMAMTSKQRAYLRSLASNITPVFQVGKASLTPEIVTAVDEALEKRELIKISVLKNCFDDPTNWQIWLLKGHVHRSFR